MKRTPETKCRKSQCNVNHFTSSMESKIQLVFDTIDTGILVISKSNGIVLCCNPKACKTLGKSLGDIEGKHYSEVFYPEFVAMYENCLESNRLSIAYRPELSMWIQFSMKVICWDEQDSILLSITNVDEESLNVENGWKRRSHNYGGVHDDEILLSDINAIVKPELASIILISFENIVEIRKYYGIRNLEILMSRFYDWFIDTRPIGEKIYRVHNGIVLLNIGISQEVIKKRAARIVKLFKTAWTISDEGVHLSINCLAKVGIVFGAYIQNNIDIILNTSWIIPYDDDYDVYDENKDKITKHYYLMRYNLAKSIHNNMDGFRVYYQPIVNLATMMWSGVEASCEWASQHSLNEMPCEIFSKYDKLSLSDQVADWVRFRAMEECVSLGLDHKEFFLNVSLSPGQIMDDHFVWSLQKQLSETGYASNKLNLKITDNVGSEFGTANIDGMNQLERIRVKLWIDNFRTDYSFLVNLKKITAAILKTDRSFRQRFKFCVFSEERIEYLTRFFT